MIRAAVARAALAALALGGGCDACGRDRPGARATSPCSAAAPEVAALRDGDGALVRTLRDAGDGRTAICSPTGAVTGFLSADSVKREIATAAGAARAQLVREGASDVTVTGSPALRLHDEGGELRVLRPDGIPLGAVSRAPPDGPAVADAADGGAAPAPPLARVYDPGGRPIGTVVAHGRGFAIRAADGATQWLLAPRPPVDDPRLAGLVAVTGLSPDDALAIAWAFPPPQPRAK